MEQKKPERMSAKDMESGNDNSSGGKLGKLGGIQGYIINGIITVALIILCSNFIGVTTKIYNDHNKTVDGEINTINASLKTMQTSVNAIPTSINTSVTSAVGDLKTQMSTFTSSVNTLQSSITTNSGSIKSDEDSLSSLKSQLSTMQSSISSLQTAVGNVNTSKLQTDLSAAQSSITTLNTTISSLQSELAVDEAAIKKLQTTPTTTTSTGGGLTANGVTVALAANPYYGKPVIAYLTSIPVSTPTVPSAATQQFSFSVTNNGTTNINSLQLAIGLTLYNSAGTSLATLPSDAVVTMTTLGLGTTWTNEGYVQANTIGFQNAVSTGIFAGLGNIPLAVGQTQTF